MTTDSVLSLTETFGQFAALASNEAAVKANQPEYDADATSVSAPPGPQQGI